MLESTLPVNISFSLHLIELVMVAPSTQILLAVFGACEGMTTWGCLYYDGFSSLSFYQKCLTCKTI